MVLPGSYQIIPLDTESARRLSRRLLSHYLILMLSVSHRLLPALQLTRMALVFTAIADSLCGLLLLAQHRADRAGDHFLQHLNWIQVIAMAFVSVGLYGYGMSLNDIIDRRRDQRLAAHRPLPSGRIDVRTAHVLCFLLGLLALFAGAVLASQSSPGSGWMTMLLILWSGMLITFYDTAAKYLVAPGLLTLGLIRFFHATIPAPELPLPWHPLWLLNHVAILSAICYHLEEKRPPLTRLHWWTVPGGLGLLNLIAIAAIWYRHHRPGHSIAEVFRIERGLLLPVLATLVFIALAIRIGQGLKKRQPASSTEERKGETPRPEAGRKLMLYGLLWLIVYDAAFVAGYVSPLAALVLLLLLPVAYLCIQLMRSWSKLASLSQTPDFKRDD